MTADDRLARLESLVTEMRQWAGPASEWDQDDPTPQTVLRWADHLDAALSSASPPTCDGNHGAPRCADPECWQDDEPAAAGSPPSPPKEQIERLAALAHEQWAGWMRYLFAQCPELSNGSRLVPVEWATRWVRQMKTPYAELSETEKDSDREEARRVLAALAAAGSPPSPHEFQKCPELWDERFRRLVKTLRTQAEEANAPTMARRFEQCEDAIVNLLLGGSPPSPETET